MKKILMLGASHFQVPAIKYAKEAGYHVITADYKPNNPGHFFSDEYHNISTIDKNSVLDLASKLGIDGVLSYASDPGAPTAAYLAQKLNLPGNPYESVLTLQRKDLFRAFLAKHGFNVPRAQAFSQQAEALEYAEWLLSEYGQVIVKPVDSSGSKGVTKLSSDKDFINAFTKAMCFSLSNQVIVEQFIEKHSHQMDGDGFVWDGKLVFSCLGTQHNDLECNPYVPVGISFPYIADEEIQNRARQQIDRIMSMLEMKVGGLNIEFIIDQEGEVYLLEIGPRSGGNLIPEVIRYATGIDLIAYSVEGALGQDCSDLKPVACEGWYSSYILHAQKQGRVKSIFIDALIKPHIIEQNIMVNVGDKVEKFDGSHHTLGTFILQFETQQEMVNLMDKMNKYIRVIVE